VGPADPALMVITQGDETIKPEDVDQLQLERVRVGLGLDKPLPIQYLVWIKDIVTMKWGVSFYTQRPILEELAERVPVTLQLGIYTVGLSVIMGIPLGIIMALRQDTWIDYVSRIFSLAGLSLPSFWTATLVIAFGVYFFNWSPRLEYAHPWDDPYTNMVMLFWPAAVIGYSTGAVKARMMRSTMLEVLRQDYIRTAHAKGLRYFVVVYRHAMKNALLPVVTVIGISVAVIIGGSVISETIFQLPGVGVYLLKGMNQRDYPVVQNVVTILSAWIILSNLLVDILYGWLDPRIRY
jgi:peptide/nickel transport system permease protein